MRKIILALAAIVAAASCTKQIGQDITPTYTYRFNGGGSMTKMTLGTYDAASTPAIWEANDGIAIYTSDGASAGTATVESSSVGNRTGNFTLTSTAAPGTIVRVLYPASATYGSSTLATEQTITNSTDGALTYSYAYSDEITLKEDESLNFTLKHALAAVRIVFQAKADGGLDSSTIEKITLRSHGAPLSGDFSIDYSTGGITTGTSVKDYVAVTIGAELTSASTNTAYFTTFPTTEAKDMEIRLHITHSGSSWTVPVVFNGQLKAGCINVFDLGEISLSPDYFGEWQTAYDYYSMWLSGGSFSIAGKEISKTTFPTAQLLRGDEVSAATLNTGGLIFIDEKEGDIDITSEDGSYTDIAGANELVLVGRWKDALSQPNIICSELRANTHDASFLNVKLTSNTTEAEAFSKDPASAADTGLRFQDCHMDVQAPTVFVNLCPSSSSTNKAFTGTYVDNCIVNLPRHEAKDNALISCGMSNLGSSINVKVTNSIIFSSEPAVALNGVTTYIIKLQNNSLPQANFDFTSNTITNIQNNFGLIYFSNVTANSLTIDKNLLEATEGGSNILARNESNTIGTTTVNNNFAGRSSTVSENAWINHSSHAFTLGTGNLDSSTNPTEVTSDNIFTNKDYTVGYFTVNTAVVTNGAGALTEKKYVTAAAE